MKDWRDLIKYNVRYDGFTILKDPKPFKELFSGKDYELVRVHSIYVCTDSDIVGFCGAFAWKKGMVASLDGDSYNDNPKIYGFDDRGGDILDILVGDDW